MPAITTVPTNIYHDPLLINYASSQTISITARYFIRATTSAADLTLTISSYRSHAIHNVGTNRLYIQGTDVSPVSVEAGHFAICSWDVQNGRHYTSVLDQGRIVEDAVAATANLVTNQAIKTYVDARVAVTYSQTAIPASGSASGFYSVQTGASRGLYFSHGVGLPMLLLAYNEDGDWPV